MSLDSTQQPSWHIRAPKPNSFVPPVRVTKAEPFNELLLDPRYNLSSDPSMPDDDASADQPPGESSVNWTSEQVAQNARIDGVIRTETTVAVRIVAEMGTEKPSATASHAVLGFPVLESAAEGALADRPSTPSRKSHGSLPARSLEGDTNQLKESAALEETPDVESPRDSSVSKSCPNEQQSREAGLPDTSSAFKPLSAHEPPYTPVKSPQQKRTPMTKRSPERRANGPPIKRSNTRVIKQRQNHTQQDSFVGVAARPSPKQVLKKLLSVAEECAYHVGSDESEAIQSESSGDYGEANDHHHSTRGDSGEPKETTQTDTVAKDGQSLESGHSHMLDGTSPPPKALLPREVGPVSPPDSPVAKRIFKSRFEAFGSSGKSASEGETRLWSQSEDFPQSQRSLPMVHFNATQAAPRDNAEQERERNPSAPPPAQASRSGSSPISTGRTATNPSVARGPRLGPTNPQTRRRLGMTVQVPERPAQPASAPTPSSRLAARSDGPQEPNTVAAPEMAAESVVHRRFSPDGFEPTQIGTYVDSHPPSSPQILPQQSSSAPVPRPPSGNSSPPDPSSKTVTHFSASGEAPISSREKPLTPKSLSTSPIHMDEEVSDFAEPVPENDIAEPTFEHPPVRPPVSEKYGGNRRKLEANGGERKRKRSGPANDGSGPSPSPETHPDPRQLHDDTYRPKIAKRATSAKAPASKKGVISTLAMPVGGPSRRPMRRAGLGSEAASTVDIITRRSSLTPSLTQISDDISLTGNALPPKGDSTEADASGRLDQLLVLAKWGPGYYPGHVTCTRRGKYVVVFLDDDEDVAALSDLRHCRFEIGDRVKRADAKYKKDKKKEFIVQRDWQIGDDAIQVKGNSGEVQPLKLSCLYVPLSIVKRDFDKRIINSDEISCPEDKDSSVPPTSQPKPFRRNTRASSRLAGQSFLLTRREGGQDDSAHVTRVIQAHGGEVVENWESLIHYKDGSGVAIRSISTPFLLVDGGLSGERKTFLKPKTVVALALGIPCLSTVFLDAIEEGDADWRGYIVSSGYSEVLKQYCSQILDMRWGEDDWDLATAQRVKQPFKNKKILFIKPKDSKPVANTIKVLVPLCCKAMGADYNEMSNISGNPSSRFDYILADTGDKENRIPAAIKASGKLCNFNWLKQCLVMGINLPPQEL